MTPNDPTLDLSKENPSENVAEQTASQPQVTPAAEPVQAAEAEAAVQADAVDMAAAVEAVHQAIEQDPEMPVDDDQPANTATYKTFDEVIAAAEALAAQPAEKSNASKCRVFVSISWHSKKKLTMPTWLSLWPTVVTPTTL